MKLGQLLCRIAVEPNPEKRIELKKDFLARANMHDEKNLLMECFFAACKGKKFIPFAKNSVPPVSLKSEGFFLVEVKGNLEYHFG